MSLRQRIVSPEGPTAPPRRVCIVLLSGIGDVVHGLPLALDIKAIDADIEVTWVAETAPAEVLEHHPAVDRVITFDSRAGLAGVRALREAMVDTHAQLTLNVQRYFKSVWPSLFSGAPARVGLPPSKTRDGVRFSNTHVLREGPWKHSQDLFLDFRWALGVPREAPVRWDITFSAEERAEQDGFFERLDGRPAVSLVVGSANPKKDWAPRRYARLAEALEADFGMQVLLVGGPSERERRAAEMIRIEAGGRAVDCLGNSVRRLMGVLAGSRLVVAPDTGPLHIAHALDIPVIGLFAHTNPWRVGPWRRYRDLIVDRYTEPGAEPDPSGYLPKNDRMDWITVDDVLAKVEVARSRYP
jgi:heptosyltransferase I